MQFFIPTPRDPNGQHMEGIHYQENHPAGVVVTSAVGANAQSTQKLTHETAAPVMNIYKGPSKNIMTDTQRGNYTYKLDYYAVHGNAFKEKCP